MAAIRGQPDDYDAWQRRFGCDGWDWPALEPLFRAVEDDERGMGGRGGTLPLHRLPAERWGALDRSLREAAVAAGYACSPDHNVAGVEGFSPCALTVRDDCRVSTNDAYLEPARARPNLTVLGDTLVDRVLLEGSRAVGVRTADGRELPRW